VPLQELPYRTSVVTGLNAIPTPVIELDIATPPLVPFLSEGVEMIAVAAIDPRLGQRCSK
jgi:hypothetical protein